MQLSFGFPPLEPRKEPRKTKRKPIPKAVKESVWKKYFGRKMTGKCYVCKAPTDYFTFEIGHNKSVAKGGKNHLENLRPTCRSCNRSMGKMSIETFKKKYFTKKLPNKNIKNTLKSKICPIPFCNGKMRKIKIFNRYHWRCSKCGNPLYNL